MRVGGGRTMRRAGRSAAAAALIVMAAAQPAPAGVTRDVEARNFEFAPSEVRASPGDTIRWTVTGGSHDVVAYAGAASFSSGMMSSASPPYTHDYAGGTIFYRCTPHSTLTPGGTCSGMCGVIVDAASEPRPSRPVITQPADGSTVNVNPVPVAGSADPWIEVEILEGAAVVGEALADGSGRWGMNLRTTRGTHTIAARGVSAEGIQSDLSAPVTFNVTTNPDTLRPTVQITSLPVAVGVGEVVVEGTAADNVAVASVTVHIVDAFGVPAPSVAAECAMCPAAAVAWRLRAGVARGLYVLWATANDTASPPNVSSPSSEVRAVVV